jgi:hypothetical protein
MKLSNFLIRFHAASRSIGEMAGGLIRSGLWANLEIGEQAQYRTEWLRLAFEEDAFERFVKPLRRRAAQFRAWAHECLLAGRRDLFDEWHTLARKLEDKADSLAYDACYAKGNLLLNEGINTLWDLLAGQGAETNYGNANARLGVGNDATAPSATQTGLIGGSSLYKAMNGSFPTTGSSQQIVLKSDFTTGEANFAWLEETADNGSGPSKNLHRANTNLGTKTSGTWTLTDTITLS